MAVLFILLLVAVANAQSAFDPEWSRESFLNIDEDDEFTGDDLRPLLNLRFSDKGARVISPTATAKNIELLPSLKGTTGYSNGGLHFGFDTNGVWSIGNIDFRDPDTFWDICPEGYTVSRNVWCTEFDDDYGDYEDEYGETFPWVESGELFRPEDVKTCVNLCYNEETDDYLPVTEPNQPTGLLFKMTINFGKYDRVCWAVDVEEGSEDEAMLQMIWGEDDWKAAWVNRFGNVICSGVDGEYPIASPWGRKLEVLSSPSYGLNMGSQAIFSLPVIGENTYPGANMLRFYPRKGYTGPVYEEWDDKKKRQLEDTTDSDHSSLYGVGSPTGAFNLAFTLTRIPKDNTKEDDFLCSYDRVHYIFHLYSGGTLAATWKVYADHEINLEDGEDHTFVLAAPRVAEWDHSSDEAWPLLYIDGRPICASTNNYYPWDAVKIDNGERRVVPIEGELAFAVRAGKKRQVTNEMFELEFTRALAGFRALLSEVPYRGYLSDPCRADCPGCDEYCDVCNDLEAADSCDWPQCELCDLDCETCTQPDLPEDDDDDGGGGGPEEFSCEDDWNCLTDSRCADSDCTGPFNDCTRGGELAEAGKRFQDEDEAYIDEFGCLEDDFPEFYGLYPSYCRDRPDTVSGAVHSYASEDELFAKNCGGIRLFLGNLPIYWPENGQPTRFLTETALHGSTFVNFRVWNYNGIPEPSNPRLCSPKFQESCDAYRNSPWCRAYDRKSEVLLDGGKLSDFGQRCAVRCNSDDDCAEDERCVQRVYPYDLADQDELDGLIGDLSSGYLEFLAEDDPEELEAIRKLLSEEDALNDPFDYRWGSKADLDKYIHNVHRTEDLAYTGLGSNPYQGVCLKGCGKGDHCNYNEICTKGSCMCGKGPACPENHWCDGAYCRCGNDDQCEALETCEYSGFAKRGPVDAEDSWACLCGEDECDENETCQKTARGVLFCGCGNGVECDEDEICNSDKECEVDEAVD